MNNIEAYRKLYDHQVIIEKIIWLAGGAEAINARAIEMMLDYDPERIAALFDLPVQYVLEMDSDPDLWACLEQLLAAHDRFGLLAQIAIPIETYRRVNGSLSIGTGYAGNHYPVIYAESLEELVDACIRISDWLAEEDKAECLAAENETGKGAQNEASLANTA